MQEKLLYLAGGITGLTFEQATAWRREVAGKCPSWLKALSPLRGKEFIHQLTAQGDGKVADHYAHVLATPKGIVGRDRNDVRRCDAILVNFLGATTVSIGTVMEVAWADAFGKPIIMAMEAQNLHRHSMIETVTPWIVEDLDQAVAVAVQVLGCGEQL